MWIVRLCACSCRTRHPFLNLIVTKGNSWRIHGIALPGWILQYKLVKAEHQFKARYSLNSRDANDVVRICAWISWACYYHGRDLRWAQFQSSITWHIHICENKIKHTKNDSNEMRFSWKTLLVNGHVFIVSHKWLYKWKRENESFHFARSQKPV